MTDRIHPLPFYMATLLLALSAIAPQLSWAENSDDIFIPDNLLFYNPLKQTDNRVEISALPSTTGLDNQALEQAAMHFRDNQMNSTQRALNYQWLHQHHHQTDLEHDSKVLSKLLKMGLRTYWDNMQKPGFMTGKNSLGTGSGSKKSYRSSFTKSEVDYDLKISGNKLKLSMDYKF
ncbi:hypothetical protein FKG94_02195 [Exilibacterium tricleocarpae]|uniref:Uncharacterized protein n=1 Tax=Exilibacterium tricleocarpae TaxID=2591008 RepID=A0A545U873_9GAMM|nr:hypothetical protein [Exilibacterium tricleocarpae]TQV85675.1 hypothetical protein FKG94_02195 [Exilibacterium tricleocarpae]